MLLTNQSFPPLKSIKSSHFSLAGASPCATILSLSTTSQAHVCSSHSYTSVLAPLFPSLVLLLTATTSLSLLPFFPQLSKPYLLPSHFPGYTRKFTEPILLFPCKHNSSSHLLSRATSAPISLVHDHNFSPLLSAGNSNSLPALLLSLKHYLSPYSSSLCLQFHLQLLCNHLSPHQSTPPFLLITKSITHPPSISPANNHQFSITITISPAMNSSSSQSQQAPTQARRELHKISAAIRSIMPCSVNPPRPHHRIAAALPNLCRPFQIRSPSTCRPHLCFPVRQITSPASISSSLHTSVATATHRRRSLLSLRSVPAAPVLSPSSIFLAVPCPQLLRAHALTIPALQFTGDSLTIPASLPLADSLCFEKKQMANERQRRLLHGIEEMK